MKKVTQTSNRKTEHLRINLEENISSGVSTGLENYHFIHNALPELDLGEINLNFESFGKTINAPIFISSMTGGATETTAINRNLAIAANELNIPMGVGSQRAAIEDPELVSTFKIRNLAPDIPLFANLGAVQLNYAYGLNECQAAVDMISADALILHLNPLQEALQPEGDTNFSNLIEKIGEVVDGLNVPVIIKEVGWGISLETAKKLSDASVRFIDVAGAGGTSWSQIEKFRSKNEIDSDIASQFRSWGIPTANSIVELSTSDLPITIFASGGLKSGLDAAKCLALGAEMCGFAGGIIKAAAISADETIKQLRKIIKELQITMFVTGAENIKALKIKEIQKR